MNWITKVTPPGLKTMLAKKDTPDDLWVKCPLSGELVYKTDLEENWHVTPAGAVAIVFFALEQDQHFLAPHDSDFRLQQRNLIFCVFRRFYFLHLRKLQH